MPLIVLRFCAVMTIRDLAIHSSTHDYNTLNTTSCLLCVLGASTQFCFCFFFFGQFQFQVSPDVIANTASVLTEDRAFGRHTIQSSVKTLQWLNGLDFVLAASEIEVSSGVGC